MEQQEHQAHQDVNAKIYQSGQAVPTDGWYEPVGLNIKTGPLKEPKYFALHTGEIFPNYDGRAICWYLVRVGLSTTSSANHR